MNKKSHSQRVKEGIVRAKKVRNETNTAPTSLIPENTQPAQDVGRAFHRGFHRGYNKSLAEVLRALSDIVRWGD